MPKYEVVKDAGVGMEVGKIIVTDNLHPSLFQHVRQISAAQAEEQEQEQEEQKPEEAKPTGKGRKAPVEPPKPDDDDNT